MSRSTSPSANKPYGITRVCRVWRFPRATAFRHQSAITAPADARAKRDPRGVLSDQQILDAIRIVLEQPEFLGEGYRKVWARLRPHPASEPLRVACFASRASTTCSHRHPQASPDGPSTTMEPSSPSDPTRCGREPRRLGPPDGSPPRATPPSTSSSTTAPASASGHTRQGEEPASRPSSACGRPSGATKDHYEVGIAGGISLRHDHGSQFISNAFQDELKTVGIEFSPSFVRQPQGNGCVERFIRTLKEQLLWVRPFDSVEQLDLALCEFAQRLNEHWILGRLGYRRPAQHRRSLLAQAA